MKLFLIIIASIAFGAFSFWTLSPLFIDKEVNDELDPVLQARLDAQRKVDEARAAKESEQVTNSSVDTETTEDVTDDLEVSVAESYGINTRGPFEIIDTVAHPASGYIEIIESPEEKLVYYKDYDGTNGPDLKVYLSKDLDAKEIYGLGDAKGNRGNLIYGVPLDVDFSDYKYVLTWCEAFGVLFDYAEIN